MDIKDYLVPISCFGQGCPADETAQNPIQPGLEHLQGGGIHNFSGQLCWGLSTLRVKNFCLTSTLNLHSFQFKAILPYPALFRQCKNLVSLLHLSSPQVVEDCVPPELQNFLFSRPKTTSSLSLYLIREVLQPSVPPFDHGPPFDLLQQLHIFIELGSPRPIYSTPDGVP